MATATMATTTAMKTMTTATILATVTHDGSADDDGD